jgi:hypothetical protein
MNFQTASKIFNACLIPILTIKLNEKLLNPAWNLPWQPDTGVDAQGQAKCVACERVACDFPLSIIIFATLPARLLNLP